MQFTARLSETSIKYLGYAKELAGTVKNNTALEWLIRDWWQKRTDAAHYSLKLGDAEQAVLYLERRLEKKEEQIRKLCKKIDDLTYGAGL